jgi:hypothetical protein
MEVGSNTSTVTLRVVRSLITCSSVKTCLAHSDISKGEVWDRDNSGGETAGAG